MKVYKENKEYSIKRNLDLICDDEWTKERVLVNPGDSFNFLLKHNETVEDVTCKAAFSVSRKNMFNVPSFVFLKASFSCTKITLTCTYFNVPCNVAGVDLRIKVDESEYKRLNYF